MSIKSFVRYASLALLVAAVGCGQTSSDKKTDKPAASAEALPSSLVMSSKPDLAPVSVADARKSAKVGDEIALHGFVGGSKSPFVDGRAVLTLVDHSCPNKCISPDDHCSTPWDYCCDLEQAMASSASVRVMNGEQLIKAGIKGHGGIKELSELIVVGKVSAVSADNLQLDATGIHVVKADYKQKS